MNVIQIIYLILSHDYFGYLIIQVIMTILSNWALSRKADKMYPFLKDKKIKAGDAENQGIMFTSRYDSSKLSTRYNDFIDLYALIRNIIIDIRIIRENSDDCFLCKYAKVLHASSAISFICFSSMFPFERSSSKLFPS